MTTLPPNLDQWRPAVALWIELAERQPQLTISPTVPAWYGFIRHHKEELIGAGVIIRLRSREWIGDPQRFAGAVQAIKCGAPVTRFEVRHRRKGDRIRSSI